ncbi:hypothetical protein M407DRAFT_32749 [Tulasnella calospora MUT 4182]|uniref:Uncharacterized protein n=1 Tax=Tulasnella calospora MUT 4182 TaxID=1051891 RepID=A0A0C3L7T0_9AGAM|nr:hypothetical protein M407DRAFT_32749 [Tulasnella calospora MUT 4182]
MVAQQEAEVFLAQQQDFTATLLVIFIYLSLFPAKPAKVCTGFGGSHNLTNVWHAGFDVRLTRISKRDRSGSPARIVWALVQLTTYALPFERLQDTTRCSSS